MSNYEPRIPFKVRTLRQWPAGIAIVIAAALGAGCSSKMQATAGNGQPPPPLVEVINVAASDVPIYSEFAAQTFARNRVEVRGRVDGYVEKWLFKPGDQVKASQTLDALHIRPYRTPRPHAAGDLKPTA